MIKTRILTKDQLPFLFDPVYKLISIGYYSFYSIKPNKKNIKYVLRTGPSELYFITNDGKYLVEHWTDFEIFEKIKILDEVDPFYKNIKLDIDN